MELTLRRYSETTTIGNGSYKNLLETCKEFQDIVEKDDFMKNHWNQIVMLTHSLFKRQSEKVAEKLDTKTTNAYWKMTEIWNHYKFSFNEVRHFDIACAPGFFILAIQEICQKNNIKYSFNGFTLQEGLELDDSLKESPNIFYHNILKGDINSKYYKKYNLVTGDIGIETNYESIEELQLIELEKAQMEIALKLVENGGSIILKMFTYSQKETIRIVDEFSKHFDKSFIFKPLSSRVLNNESYLVGIHFDEYSTNGKGSNAEDIEVFESKRQSIRIEYLEAATKIVKLKNKQFDIIRSFT